MAKHRDPRKWLFGKVPDEASALVFCFPYAGAGAASYRRWPRTIKAGAVAAVQPPGRENRFAEPPFPTHREYGADLGAFLSPFTDRDYVFFAHCGGVPFALETALWLAEHGRRPPRKLVASSWGPPHKDLYGGLNKVDIERHDFVAEIQEVQRGLGNPDMPVELARIGATVLRQEVEVHRPWRYDAARRVPCPVVAVAWEDDDVVPPAEAVDPAWSEVADTEFRTLPGNHWAFASCPESLRLLLAE
ncbi:thioesterase domain-containing protein [Dactylosporangium sp. NPDC000555]|uniref:thioesterase II family protein n=1 Tax=Dactylosporangium sp. NPDC000555 TaxID=3154260 RepID=UPI00331CC100